jgi:hypothetical protein
MLGMPAHTVLDDFPANAGLLLGGRITPYLPRLSGRCCACLVNYNGVMYYYFTLDKP